MIYAILLVIIALMSAVMDADEAISNWFLKKAEATKHKFWKNFWKQAHAWSDSSSWENKHNLHTWLKKHNVPFARAISQDVAVVFTDMWHNAKSILFACLEYMAAVLMIADVNQLLVYVNFPIIQITVGWLTFILFIVVGSIFNFFYYKLRKV